MHGHSDSMNSFLYLSNAHLQTSLLVSALEYAISQLKTLVIRAHYIASNQTLVVVQVVEVAAVVVVAVHLM